MPAPPNQGGMQLAIEYQYANDFEPITRAPAIDKILLQQVLYDFLTSMSETFLNMI